LAGLDGDGVADGETWEGTREWLRSMGIRKQGRRFESRNSWRNFVVYIKNIHLNSLGNPRSASVLDESNPPASDHRATVKRSEGIWSQMTKQLISIIVRKQR
jgi:hypothetical protein